MKPGELEKKIEDYLNGKLTKGEIDQLWAYIFENPEAYEHLKINAQLREIYQQKKSGQANVTNISFASRYGKWIGALAAVMILAIAINLFRVSDHPRQISAIDQIDLLEMETTAITRAADAPLSGADSLLHFAYQEAVDDNYSAAADLYAELVSRYPDTKEASQAYFNNGVLHYNRGEYRYSVSFFQSGLAIDHDDFFLTEKTHWYLGHTYINLDDLEKAREAFIEVYETDGFYKDSAYRLLRQINLELGFENEISMQ